MFYDDATGDEYSSEFTTHPIFDSFPRRERMTISPRYGGETGLTPEEYVVDLNFIIIVLLIFFVTLLAVSTYYSRVIRNLEKKIDSIISGRQRVGSYDSDEEY